MDEILEAAPAEVWKDPSAVTAGTGKPYGQAKQ